MKQVIIKCRRVKFYSSFDEDAFFEWLGKIKSIEKVKGEKDVIFLYLKESAVVTNDDLQNIVALFRRYKINIRNLINLISEENKEFFEYALDGYSINVYPSDT